MSKLIEKDLSHGVIHDLNAQVTFNVAVYVVTAAGAATAIAAAAFQIDRYLIVENHTCKVEFQMILWL